MTDLQVKAKIESQVIIFNIAIYEYNKSFKRGPWDVFANVVITIPYICNLTFQLLKKEEDGETRLWLNEPSHKNKNDDWKSDFTLLKDIKEYIVLHINKVLNGDESGILTKSINNHSFGINDNQEQTTSQEEPQQIENDDVPWDLDLE